MPVDDAAPINSNTAGGYKAAIANPRVGESARAHAREVLDEMEDMHGDLSGEYVDPGDRDDSIPADEVVSEPRDVLDMTSAANEKSGKNEGNVIGGYKATLSNNSSSEEAKERARAELDKRGMEY
ncbi:hypothetical protein AURDEDRAFT_168475 [Auricularia subglabra TFB-10046 SS5]|nr:hypothetical protein AURDEDRAFT_168475 [Auricularia subglabra TFB-10046 SS5]